MYKGKGRVRSASSGKGTRVTCHAFFRVAARGRMSQADRRIALVSFFFPARLPPVITHFPTRARARDTTPSPSLSHQSPSTTADGGTFSCRDDRSRFADPGAMGASGLAPTPSVIRRPVAPGGRRGEGSSLALARERGRTRTALEGETLASSSPSVVDGVRLVLAVSRPAVDTI